MESSGFGPPSVPANPKDSLKALVAKPWGRALLVALVIVLLSVSVIYLGYLLAIPIFIIVGLAVPIYAGWSRPRTLFLIGLVAVLIAGPIVSAGEVAILQQPVGPSYSSSVAPYNGSVLADAVVHPYYAANPRSFTFSVNVNPASLPASSSGISTVDLFLSTCPGATGPNDSSCGGAGAYTFYQLNISYFNDSTPRSLLFNQTISGTNVYWWTIGAEYYNLTNASHPAVWVYLDVSNGYGTVEGPVVGSFAGLIGLVLPSIYLTLFLYPGLVFFIALLIYIFLKSRRQVRAGRAPGGPSAPAAAGPGGPASPGAGTSGTVQAPAADRRPESKCPQCGAVVYAGETRCWKCGASLTAPPPSGGGSQPLPSGKT